MLEELVSRIAVAANIACPYCRTTIRWDRVKVVRKINERTYELDLSCGDRCNKGRNVRFTPYDARYKSARQLILGDRNLEEEAKLLESGPVPKGYEKDLPEIIGAILPDVRWENPQPPKAIT